MYGMNEKLGYVPEKLYHFTLKENLLSIEDYGALRAGCDGYVYMTETMHDACVFANIYSYVYKRPITDYAIIELNTGNIELDKLFISYDHNPEYFPIEENAVMYRGDVKLCNADWYDFD